MKLADAQHPWHAWMVLGTIILGLIAVVGSAVSTGVANPTIQGELAYNTSDSVWISTAYLIMLTLSLPVAPYLAERWGYKSVYFYALLCFLAGSVLGGAAVDFYSLLVCRVVEGVGAGVLFTVSLTIVARSFSGARLVVAVALFMGVGYGLGFVAGFLAGGYFAQYGHWQMIFFSNVLYGVPGLLLTWRVMQETERKPQPPFDVAGYACFTLFLVALLLALSSAKEPWNSGGWGSTLVVCSLTASAVGLAALVAVEWRAAHPIIVLKLFAIRSFTVGSLTVMLVGAQLFATLSLFPVFLESDLRYDKLTAALMLTVAGGVLGIFGALTGYLGKRVDVRLISLIGLCLLVVSSLLNQTLTIQSDHLQIGLLLGVRTLGVSLSLGSLTTLSLSDVPSSLLGAASSLNSFFRQAGVSFGGALAGAMVIERQIFHVARYGSAMLPDAPVYQRVFQGIADRAGTVGGSPPQEALLQARRAIVENVVHQAHITAINDAFCVLGWASAVAALFLSLMTLQSIRK
jgi:EmrB/QacA subfamily drug resistance transporter